MAAVVTIGVDVGQRIDPSAVVVAEAGREERTDRAIVVRHIERLPLGTPYPGVARRVASVACGVRARLGSRVPLGVIIDVTGVGRPVFDLIAAELGDLDARLVAATFTFGDRYAETGDEWRVGKGYLVSRLQSLLQTDRLKLPETGEARQLAAELLDYEIRVDPDGDAKFGAFKVGRHDDLATALGLAVLRDDGIGGGPIEPVTGATAEFYRRVFGGERSW